MSLIAIVGAGPLAGALAHKLAGRSRIAEIRLIDPAEAVARGKALDILQSAPVDGWSARLSGDGSIHAASGADVIVLADAADGSEHAGEAGLALLRHLRAIGVVSPIVFAGATQRELMTRSVTELRLDPVRVIGSAPLALSGALRALAAVALDGSAVEIKLNVFGAPPRHWVAAWEEATVGGQPLTSALGPHEIAALSARIPGLWPPGPYTLGSAAARIAEAMCIGSRRQFPCFVDAGRGRIVALPVELKRGGIKRVIQPTLTTLERTALESAGGAQ